jgi:primosomal protein N' (replication factor Y)
MASGLTRLLTQFLAIPSRSQLPRAGAVAAGIGNVRRTVRVLPPLPLADAYDYSVPDGLEVAPGHFVIVPLGKRETIGVVWGEGSGEVAPEKLRDIDDVLPALPMADALRRFVDWVRPTPWHRPTVRWR